ncbi:MAG: sugar ABC transporter substrate-binding protein [Treponema sp.]|jgi:ABC-type sugar transport system substrate-binding protein|nr:sugar ABC transporter substrate-binding protein [Treponema sp.]
MLLKQSVLIAGMTLYCAVTAFGGGIGGAPRSGGTGKVIAISMNALDEFQTEWWGYFKEYGESKGCRILMTNAEGKVDKQLQDVESLIQQRPDIIVIRVTDSDGAAPAFEACNAAGIPTIDSSFGVNYRDTFKLLSSQYALCALQAEYCITWLKSHPGEELRIGYLWGTQGVSAVTDRYLGWKETLFAAYPGRARILAEKVCNWSAVETMAAVEDWMQAFPQMNCIVAMSDEMALAATNVLQAAGKRLEDCIVVGIDGSPSAQKALKDGILSATVYTSKRAEARYTVDYAIRIINGEWDALRGTRVDPGYEIAALMTASNLREILAKDK